MNKLPLAKRAQILELLCNALYLSNRPLNLADIHAEVGRHFHLPACKQIRFKPGFEAKRAAVTANRRVGEPQDIADVAAYLASPRAAYVNAAELAVDGGMTSMLMDMVPRPGFNQTTTSPQAVAHA